MNPELHSMTFAELAVTAAVLPPESRVVAALAKVVDGKIEVERLTACGAFQIHLSGDELWTLAVVAYEPAEMQPGEVGDVGTVGHLMKHAGGMKPDGKVVMVVSRTIDGQCVQTAYPVTAKAAVGELHIEATSCR